MAGYFEKCFPFFPMWDSRGSLPGMFFKTSISSASLWVSCPWSMEVYSSLLGINNTWTYFLNSGYAFLFHFFTFHFFNKPRIVFTLKVFEDFQSSFNVVVILFDVFNLFDCACSGMRYLRLQGNIRYCFFSF